MRAHHPLFSVSCALALACAVTVGCSRKDATPAPQHSPLYIASQQYKGNLKPREAAARDCDREIDEHQACGGNARRWFGTTATDKRSTPERMECLQSIRQLPSCKALADSGQILVTITAQRVNGADHGRKVWGKDFIELQD